MLDVNDPMWAKAKAWAHKTGLSQEAFQQAVDLLAAHDTITPSQVQRARGGEIAKLGTTGPARIAALETAYKRLLGPDDAKAVMSRVWTAADVARHEKIIAKFTTTTREHRAPGKVSDAEFEAMTPVQRWDYARQHTGAGAR